METLKKAATCSLKVLASYGEVKKFGGRMGRGRVGGRRRRRGMGRRRMVTSQTAIFYLQLLFYSISNFNQVPNQFKM